jgi:YggT family protein
MMSLFRVLGALTSLYMFLCFLRVMLTWFDGASLGRPYEILASAVDPYLNWFRRFPSLGTEGFDFSPVAALAVLALVNNVFVTVGLYGRITVGILFSLVISGAWSAVVFILGFFIVVLVLRLISLSAGRQGTSPIWSVIDAVSRPVLFRISRIIFRDRLVSYRKGIIVSIASLAGVWIIGGFVVHLVTGILNRLPF